jgi:Zn-dependent M28 family amino/carboxypeptidase
VGPGANDNASGVGALIEIARIASQKQTRPYTLRFIFFGSEERVGSNPNNHHFGARYYVKHMSSAEKKSTIEMICVDMVANGTVLTLRSLKKTPDVLSKKFLREADSLNIPNVYKQAGDDSDFEAFERAGITTTWLEWRPGYYWHTQKDTYDRLNKNCLLSTGRLLQKHLFN